MVDGRTVHSKLVCSRLVDSESVHGGRSVLGSSRLVLGSMAGRTFCKFRVASVGLVCYLFSFVPTPNCSSRRSPHFIVIDIDNHVSLVILCLPRALIAQKHHQRHYEQ